MDDQHFDLTGLIRSLQREEGHQDCFRRGALTCDRMDCPWREFCLPGPEPVIGNRNKPK